MQKKSASRSAFFNRRALATLLVCGAACSILTGTLLAFFRSELPTTTGFQRTLTFAERVAYQRAIEEVYWRHRIWPKERPDPKPSLDAVMSQGQVENKVEDYLRKSQTLEDYWQRPITADQLQAEMDRMARDTKQPEVLRELFEALGNDPFVIAECLARPTLVERLSPLANRGRRQVRKLASNGASEKIATWRMLSTRFPQYRMWRLDALQILGHPRARPTRPALTGTRQCGLAVK